jgi:hypothetical protein
MIYASRLPRETDGLVGRGERRELPVVHPCQQQPDAGALGVTAQRPDPAIT